MILTLTLPLPAKGLWPNDRPHRQVKTALIRVAREHAKRQMFVGMRSIDCPLWRISGYRIKGFFKTKRHPDDDNIIASNKFYRDGIAEAAGQDDREFKCLEVITDTDKDNPRFEIVLELIELI